MPVHAYSRHRESLATNRHMKDKPGSQSSETPLLTSQQSVQESCSNDKKTSVTLTPSRWRSFLQPRPPPCSFLHVQSRSCTTVSFSPLPYRSVPYDDQKPTRRPSCRSGRTCQSEAVITLCLLSRRRCHGNIYAVRIHINVCYTTAWYCDDMIPAVIPWPFRLRACSAIPP